MFESICDRRMHWAPYRMGGGHGRIGSLHKVWQCMTCHSELSLTDAIPFAVAMEGTDTPGASCQLHGNCSVILDTHSGFVGFACIIPAGSSTPEIDERCGFSQPPSGSLRTSTAPSGAGTSGTAPGASGIRVRGARSRSRRHNRAASSGYNGAAISGSTGAAISGSGSVSASASVAGRWSEAQQVGIHVDVAIDLISGDSLPPKRD